MDKDIVHPLITVLLPVYNLERYVKETIDSILNQTFTDFELLIINDGSTDASKEIILSFNDNRIHYIENTINIGLIATLNKGIDLAKGKYIARMDGDDIAFPERLTIQLDYINKNDVTLVCSPVACITPDGKARGIWHVDTQTKTWEEIKSMLPQTNCIAHPTVLIKADILKKYKYNVSFKGSEDWELWMRLVSDGHKIIKTKETLLKYRIHPDSVTIVGHQAQTSDQKIIKVKKTFFIQRLLKLKLGMFEMQVFYSLLRSIARNFKLIALPQFLRNCKRLITINPFKAYKQYKEFKKVCGENVIVDLFFFFPYADIGGAEKVHANIVEVFSDKKVLVFITGISDKENFLYMFQKFAPTLKIGYALNYPLFEKMVKRTIFSIVESQEKPIVFGCNNLFFYESILKFSKKVRVFDLMHDFRFENEANITHQFLPQYARCEKRIFISSKAIEETKKFYKTNYVDEKEYDKIELITNYTFIPDEIPQKVFNKQLKVLYVGRDTAEKRAYLVEKIASACIVKSATIEFTAIGELDKIKSSDVIVNYTGPIYNFQELEKYYNEYHIIIITSEREGFPLAIAEGMAHGLVPISTPVGDVPVHVTKDVGFVTSSVNEITAVDEMVKKIIFLDENRKALEAMSKEAFTYAQQHFSKEEFSKKYKAALGF